MNLEPEQLPRHLARQLAPLYVVHGEEALLAIEAADRIRAAAIAQGYTEREVLMVESGFDWRRLWAAGASLSLFATRRLVEIRLSSASPGAEGGEALARHAGALPADTITLVSLPKLDRRARETRWFTALEAAGVCVHAQKLGFAQLPAWLAGRLQAQGQSVDPETLEFLAARVEGNLLAAHQEVLKLGLLFPKGTLSPEAVRGAVSDVARYDVYDLGPAVLTGEPAHLVRMIDGLRAEGTGLPLVLWALAEEARAMLRVREATADGTPLAQALREARVWGDRQRLMPSALRRLGLPALRAALAHAARIDRIVKGVAQGDAWDELQSLALRLAAPGKLGLAGLTD